MVFFGQKLMGKLPFPEVSLDALTLCVCMRVCVCVGGGGACVRVCVRAQLFRMLAHVCKASVHVRPWFLQYRQS